MKSLLFTGCKYLFFVSCKAKTACMIQCLLIHTWLEWLNLIDTLQRPENKLLIWTGCVGAGWHLKHAGVLGGPELGTKLHYTRKTILWASNVSINPTDSKVLIRNEIISKGLCAFRRNMNISYVYVYIWLECPFNLEECDIIDKCEVEKICLLHALVHTIFLIGNLGFMTKLRVYQLCQSVSTVCLEPQTEYSKLLDVFC